MTGKVFVHEPLPIVNLHAVETDGKRFYDVDGELYPSVTTVLSSFTKQGIIEWRNRVGEEEANRVTKAATSRGTKVHLMCEDYVANKPDYKKDRMPTTVELFNQIKPYLDANVNKVYSIEGGLYSKVLKSAGRCDLICQVNGENAIIDYKTSSKHKPEDWIKNYFLQETAYAMMVYELHNISIKKIITLIATEEQGLQVVEKKPKDYINEVLTLFKLYHLSN